jgi:PTS system mannose-specific IIC component
MQGLRIAIPACALMFVSDKVVMDALNALPPLITEGMAIGGGMVVAVGYAMVINMMANKEVWPFLFIGFTIAAISDITLIGLGIIAVAMAFIYLNLEEKAGTGGGSGGGSGDPLGDILNDY